MSSKMMPSSRVENSMKCIYFLLVLIFLQLICCPVSFCSYFLHHWSGVMCFLGWKIIKQNGMKKCFCSWVSPCNFLIKSLVTCIDLKLTAEPARGSDGMDADRSAAYVQETIRKNRDRPWSQREDHSHDTKQLQHLLFQWEEEARDFNCNVDRWEEWFHRKNVHGGRRNQPCSCCSFLTSLCLQTKVTFTNSSFSFKFCVN